MIATHDTAALLEAARREARAELWRRRKVWPLLELYLDRDQLADIRAFMQGGDAERGVLPQPPEDGTADWYDDISRQRGKSWKWCTFAVVWAHCHPRQFIKYAAQLGKSVRNIIRPTINALLADMPREYRERVRVQGSDMASEAIREDKVDHKWVFPNGSEIQAAGANFGHYEDLRGQRSHLNINDECGFYDDFEAVQRVLRPQTQTTGGVNVYATTPSESPSHPSTAVMHALKAVGRYVHRTIHNHPRMSPEAVERYLRGEAKVAGLSLEQFKRTTYYQREFLCMHVAEATRLVIPEWAEVIDGVEEGRTMADVLTREVPRPRLFDTYTSADFGFTRHPSAVLFAWWDFENARLVVEDETPPLYKTRTDQLAKAYREKCRELWPTASPRPFLESVPAPPDVDAKTGDVRDPGDFWLPYMALGDKGGRGAEVLTELAKEHALHWSGAVKEADLEVMVNDLRRLVGAGKLVVHPRCKHLRHQLATGLWADKQKTDFAEDSSGHLDHLAALVYLVRAVDRQRNPYPLGYGTDALSQVVVDSGAPRGSARVLEDAFT